MGAADSSGRRLLAALADGSPAFRKPASPAAGSFGRRLLIALADAAPAFRPPPAGDGPDLNARAARTEAVPAPRRQPDPGCGAEGQDGGQHLLQDRELDELLSAIRDAAPSPAHPACQVRTRHAAMDLLATPAGPGFTVVVTATSSSGQQLLSGAETVALEAGGEYFIARLAPDGSAVFSAVPAGEWALHRLRGRRSDPVEGASFALPQARRQAELAAAGKSQGTAILKTTLPDAQARLILHRERHGGYLLEIEAGGHPEAEVPLALAVRYGTGDGGEGLVVIPARPSSLGRLPGFSPAHPWQVSLAAAAGLRALGADAIAFSVRAAGNNATRRAWREIGAAVPEFRQVIGRAAEESR